jgi:hypothetical protein
MLESELIDLINPYIVGKHEKSVHCFYSTHLDFDGSRLRTWIGDWASFIPLHRFSQHRFRCTDVLQCNADSIQLALGTSPLNLFLIFQTVFAVKGWCAKPVDQVGKTHKR